MLVRRPRTLRVRIVLSACASLLAIALLPASTTLAAGSIVVNSSADTTANDGGCTLREAIIAANTDTRSGTTAGECAAGSGTDTITFASGVRYIRIAFALPWLSSAMTIDGAKVVEIDINGWAHLEKQANVAVTLQGLTIENGSNANVANDGSGLLTIADSVITGSTAGPGVVNNGTLAVTRTTIAGNVNGASAGGGISNGGTATITDSTIRNNVVVGNVGGGIINYGTLTVTGTTIDSNTAVSGAAVENAVGASVTILASTLSNHAASALRNWGAVSLADVTITANGGAVLNGAGAAAAIRNSTLAYNTTGISNSGSAIVINSIVAGNTYGDVGSFTAGSGHNSGDIPIGSLVAGTLTANGGPTKTLRLLNLATNPLVTGGDPVVCATSPVSGRDQRGAARPADSCSIGAFEPDVVKPTAGTPGGGIRSGTTLSGGSIRGFVSLKGSDSGGSGVQRYVVARSVNGGSWSTLTSAATGTAYKATFTPGSTYRFRVKAVDFDGNVSGWTYGSTFTPRLAQQSSGAVTYKGTWTTSSNSLFSGGSARYSKSAGASVSFTATGRAFAFVTTTASSRGRAKVYVDGVYKTTIDLVAQATTYRVQAWSIRFSSSATHTIKVVVVGTSGRPRVDVDAFAVLK